MTLLELNLLETSDFYDVLSSDFGASSSATSSTTSDTSSEMSSASPNSSLDNGEDIEILCQVCQEKAGKHLYYGGQVCPSCRAFFRRAVLNNYYETFTCRKIKDCVINSKTRKSCQFCRFKKCLETGMKIAWVLPDGIRRNRKLVQASVSSRAMMPTLKMTNDDAAMIGQLLAAFKQCIIEKIGVNQQFFADMIILANTDQPLPMRTFGNFCNEQSTKSLIAIPGFQNLNANDQRTLVKANNGMITVFKQACMLDEKEFGINKGIEEAMKSGEYEALTAAR